MLRMRRNLRMSSLPAISATVTAVAVAIAVQVMSFIVGPLLGRGANPRNASPPMVPLPGPDAPGPKVRAARVVGPDPRRSGRAWYRPARRSRCLRGRRRWPAHRDGPWWPWPECPQIIIRLGYGPAGKQSPRRDVDDILDRQVQERWCRSPGDDVGLRVAVSRWPGTKGPAGVITVQNSGRSPQRRGAERLPWPAPPALLRAA